MGRLDGKRAFVTAAGQGIGRATAVVFAREGAEVIATDIDEAKLDTLAEEGVAATFRLDVLDTAAVHALAGGVGAVDVLFNCAGFVHHGTALDCSEEEWDFSFDLNVKSAHRLLRAFVPAMLKNGGGSVEKLRGELHNASGWWREIISEAEYPEASRKWFHIEKYSPEEQQAIFDRDWRQYEEWLRRVSASRVVAVELGAVDAHELLLAPNRDATSAAHPRAVDHDRIQADGCLDAERPRQFAHRAHHWQRADRDDFIERRRGHIVLQDHSDDVWFRNIRIRELNAEPQ